MTDVQNAGEELGVGAIATTQGAAPTTEGAVATTEGAAPTTQGAAPTVPVSGTVTGPPLASLPIEALQDVELKVEVVLGRARLALRDLLDVHPGVTIELDRSRNSPVDVLVNGVLFARGDVVVVDESELGVQIDEVVGGEPGERRPS